MTNQTICFFNSTETWGGGEKWHFEMASFLHKRGHNVLVIVSPHSELENRLQEQQIPTEAIDVFNFSYLNAVKVARVADFFKKHHVTTVVLNSSQDMKLGALAAKKAKLSRVIYRRGSAIPIKNTFINRYFFKQIITEVLANSEATKETINAKNSKLFPSDKITVIPNGIDVEVFDNAEFKRLYAKEGTEIVLGNLGRMVFQKNQEFLINVGVELKNRGVDFKILIGGNGKLKSILAEKIRVQNLEENIKLLGFIESPKSFMKSIDIFLLPSRWEGFGYVLAEAMLAEKPVIAFDISSNTQLVDNEKNGYLVDFDDIHMFCDKIEKLAQNEYTMKAMGIYGREKVVNEFNSNLIQERVATFLTS